MSLRDFSIFSERPWRSVSRASFWRFMRSFAIWAWRSSLSIWRYEMSFSRFSSSCLMSAGLSSAGMFVAPVGLPVSFVELTFDVTFTLRLDIIAATSLIVCVVFSESPRPFVRSDIWSIVFGTFGVTPEISPAIGWFLSLLKFEVLFEGFISSRPVYTPARHRLQLSTEFF